MADKFSFALRVACLLFAAGLLACSSEEDRPNDTTAAPLSEVFRNKVVETSLDGIPGNLVSSLREIGANTNIPATAALYAPTFTKSYFAGFNINRDIAYGPAPRNVLDVFTTNSTAQNRPVVVFVHGGGFGGGNKNSATSPFYDNIPAWVATQGMVGVNINYRYAPANTWPAGIEDMRALVAWLKTNIAQYGGNPNQIFLWGKSTGASHVADYIADIERKGEDEQVAGAILSSGFYLLGQEPVWQAYYGDDVSLYPSRNALSGLLSTDTPIFVSYAEFDGDMYKEQFKLLLEAMDSAAKRVDALYLRGHSHMSETYAVGSTDETLTGPVLAFIRRVSTAM
ncbi:MAG: alpha/beta hydrolase [Pseudomonadales bacterium]|nr:alpha/beta hydrolase [Pseudomonadales bacterium]